MTQKNPSQAGLYLHIPFCRARCGYCDFVTFTGKEDQVERYQQVLGEEIRLYAARESAPPSANTVFFGGGTPSLLDPGQVEAILQTVRAAFDLSRDAEITLEANPESISAEKAQGWRTAGVNRVSIGLQSFDDELLKAMGRLHDARQFREAYAAMRRAGYDNINIDLIYGFVGQSLESWQSTLRQVAALEPEHLSLYALTVEEHTPFGAQQLAVDGDLQAEMYDWARSFLREKNFEQYEISNFARPGKSCRHNLIYWRQQDYWGFGVGAVGCAGGVRWQNHKDLRTYFESVDAGKLPRFSEEVLDAKTLNFERLMLGLRLREGFSWGNESNSDWLHHRAELAARGLLEEFAPGRWRIPDAAVPLTNQILLPFI